MRIMGHVNTDEGFDRLQALLLQMHAGDYLCAADAATASGLSERTCQAVLEGLERAGLMTREPDDRFVRRTLDLLAS